MTDALEFWTSGSRNLNDVVNVRIQVRIQGCDIDLDKAMDRIDSARFELVSPTETKKPAVSNLAGLQFIYGGESGTRTPDTRIMIPLL